MIHNVRDYGALGNGVVDEYLAFKAAIAACEAAGGGVVYVPAGTYLIAPHDRFSGVFVSNTTPVSFRGDGIGITVIKMMRASPGDFYMFRVRSDSCSFRDITFDGGQDVIQSTIEQTHLLQVEICRRISIQNCAFRNVKGDGIRILGVDATNQVDGLQIRNSYFSECGRSGITCQRAFTNTLIHGNNFSRISDQSIDFEPSAYAAPSKVIISKNIVNHSTAPYAVTLSGVSGLHPLTDVMFVDNIIAQGSLFGTDTKNVTVRGNSITPPVGQAGIQMSRGHENLVVAGNTICTDNAVGISIFAANGRAPNGITVQDNTVSTRGVHGISLEGCQNAKVSGNRVADPMGTGVAGVQVRSTVMGAPSRNVMVTDNQLHGYRYGVLLGASPENLDTVMVAGNQVTAPDGATGKVGCAVQVVAGKACNNLAMGSNQWGPGVTPTQGIP